jgi:hypothetical protein
VISAGNGFACVDGGAGPRRFVLAIVPGMPGMMGIRLLVFVVQVKESIPKRRSHRIFDQVPGSA